MPFQIMEFVCTCMGVKLVTFVIEAMTVKLDWNVLKDLPEITCVKQLWHQLPRFTNNLEIIVTPQRNVMLTGETFIYKYTLKSINIWFFNENVNRGLCCQLLRRHHHRFPKKVCSYYRDPLMCIDVIEEVNWLFPTIYILNCFPVLNFKNDRNRCISCIY